MNLTTSVITIRASYSHTEVGLPVGSWNRSTGLFTPNARGLRLGLRPFTATQLTAIWARIARDRRE